MPETMTYGTRPRITTYKKTPKYIEEDPLIKRLIEEIDQQNTFTPEEEVILLQKAKKGDTTAIGALCIKYTKFAKFIAEHHQGQWVEVPDLVDEGILALPKSIDSFDAKKGSFTTHVARCVRAAITVTIKKQWNTIRKSQQQIERSKKIDKYIEKLEQTLGDTPTNKDIYTAMAVDPKNTNNTMSLKDIENTGKGNVRTQSLHEPLKDGTTITDSYINTTLQAPDDEVMIESRAKDIDRVLNMLGERKQTILRMYYGFPPYTRKYSMKEIAEVLGFKKSQRAHQIKKETIDMLKANNSVRDLLRGYDYNLLRAKD